MELIHNLTRHKVRSTLTISGIVIGVLALTTLGALAEYFNALIGGGVTYYSQSITVGAPAGQAALLPLAKADEIKQVPGVQAVFSTYGFNMKPGQVITVSFGVPDQIVSYAPGEEDWSALKTTVADGRRLTEASRGETVLGATVAKEFNKKVGDTIDLPVRPADAKPDFVNHTFTVVGLLDPIHTAPDNFAYVSQADAQMLLHDILPVAIRDTVDTSTITQGFTVYGAPGTAIGDLDKLADSINQQVAGIKATRPTDVVNSFKSGGAVLTAITTAAAVIALIIGCLSVVNTMFMAVAERVREIGLKKAVGATTLNIMGEFLLEATFIGLVGGLIGYGLGVLITVVGNATAPPSQGALFLVTPTLTAIAIGFATALGAIAGVLPAWRAARMDPVLALRTE